MHFDSQGDRPRIARTTTRETARPRGQALLAELNKVKAGLAQRDEELELVKAELRSSQSRARVDALKLERLKKRYDGLSESSRLEQEAMGEELRVLKGRVAYLRERLSATEKERDEAQAARRRAEQERDTAQDLQMLTQTAYLGQLKVADQLHSELREAIHKVNRLAAQQMNRAQQREARYQSTLECLQRRCRESESLIANLRGENEGWRRRLVQRLEKLEATKDQLKLTEKDLFETRQKLLSMHLQASGWNVLKVGLEKAKTQLQRKDQQIAHLQSTLSSMEGPRVTLVERPHPSIFKSARKTLSGWLWPNN